MFSRWWLRVGPSSAATACSPDSRLVGKIVRTCSPVVFSSCAAHLCNNNLFPPTLNLYERMFALLTPALTPHDLGPASKTMFDAPRTYRLQAIYRSFPGHDLDRSGQIICMMLYDLAHVAGGPEPHISLMEGHVSWVGSCAIDRCGTRRVLR